MKVVLAVADHSPLDQPYITNLYNSLQELFDLTVVVPRDFKSRSGTLDGSSKRYEARPINILHGKVLGVNLKLRVLALAQQCNLSEVHATVGWRAIGEVAASLRAIGVENVIAVDHSALLACQIAGLKAHFISLELFQRSVEQLLVRADTVRSCVTQNWLRFISLFPSSGVPHFIVPNFPPHAGRQTQLPDNEDFVLAGSAVPGFGLNVIADFLKLHPSRGTFLGWSPPNIENMLRERGLSEDAISKISFLRDFLPQQEFISRIAAHRFAFSIYDLRNAHREFFANTVGIHPWSALNYITGFPGKVGMCMNAGVPVIASNLPGMDFVHQHGVGVTVSDYGPDAILAAKAKILQGGIEMRRRCLELAKLFCFQKCIQPFLAFVARDDH